MRAGEVPRRDAVRDGSERSRVFSVMLPRENMVWRGAQVWKMPFCRAVHQNAEARSEGVGG